MDGKVFVVGFNKCGTTSLTRLFRKSGHRSAHCLYKMPNGRKINIAERVFLNRAAGNPLLRDIDACRLYSDMESSTRNWYLSAFSLYREFDEQYPDSKFILNTRDKEEWLRSRSHHRNGVYLRNFVVSTGLGSQEEVLSLWSRQWDQHLAAVRGYFANKPGKCIEFNIGEEPIAKICDFLPELKLDSQHWGTFNENASLAGKKTTATG